MFHEMMCFKSLNIVGVEVHPVAVPLLPYQVPFNSFSHTSDKPLQRQLVFKKLMGEDWMVAHQSREF